MIQLICIDLDGTLLNENQALTPAAIQAVRQAVAQGVQVVIATGRGYPSTAAFVEQLNLNCPVVTSGGAQIRIPGQQTINRAFSTQQAEHILSLALSHQSGLFIDQPERDLRFGSPSYLKMYQHVNLSSPAENEHDVLNPAPNKFSIINEPHIIQAIRRDLETTPPCYSLASPFERVLDVTLYGVTKGNALLQLCEILHIPVENTAAIGDSENDLSMMEAAGVSVAMGNAPRAIQQAANWTAPSNREEGLAHAIDYLLA